MPEKPNNSNEEKKKKEEIEGAEPGLGNLPPLSDFDTGVDV
jgi:hypothetical protein